MEIIIYASVDTPSLVLPVKPFKLHINVPFLSMHAYGAKQQASLEAHDFLGYQLQRVLRQKSICTNQIHEQKLDNIGLIPVKLARSYGSFQRDHR